MIGEAQGNISDLEFVERNPDFYRLTMNVEVRDIEHLHALSTVLGAEVQVASLKRLRRTRPRVNEHLMLQ